MGKYLEDNYPPVRREGVRTQKPVTPGAFTVATVPAAASYTGAMIYVSDGAAGNPVVAFSNGTDWLRVDTLAAISAS